MINFNQVRALCLICVVVMTFLVGTSPVKAEVDLAISQTVSNDRPGPNEVVEFTITVENLGDESALNIQVTDILSTDLILPDNQIAIPSNGSYDLSLGIWSIDELPSSGTETLIIPVMLIETPSAQCVRNKASVQHALDIILNNNIAYSGLLLGGIEACNDVEVMFVGHDTDGCTLDKRYYVSVNVRNNGIKNADNILLSVEQTSELIPNLSFISAQCKGNSGQSCLIGTLLPDENRQFYLISDVFYNNADTDVTLTLAVVMDEFDFAPENNQLIIEAIVPEFVDSCPPPTPPMNLNIGSISPGCFIATAAYGTNLAPEIKILQNFRDQYLVTNKPGIYLVNWYYKYSPPIAQYISDKSWLKAIVRGALWPVIYSIKFPFIALFTFLLMLFAMIKYKTKVKN